MSEDDVVGVSDYEGAAAGWGALKAVAEAIRGQKAIVKETHGLLQHEPATWIRLSRLCLARSEAYFVVRVLRERRQSRVMGSDGQTDDAGVLCRAYGQRTLEMERLRSRRRGSPHASDGLRSGNGSISGDFVERGASAHRCLAPRLATPRYGGVLHVRPGLQRGSLPLSAVCAGIRNQQFPRLLEHVPRGDQRRPASVNRRRQGHRDARGFRPLRCAVLHRPQSRDQSSAHAHDVARSLEARRADYRLQPATRARAGAVHRAAKSHRNADTELNADRLDLLSCEGWRRHRRAEGDDEDPRDAGCEKPRGRRPGCSRP